MTAAAHTPPAPPAPAERRRLITTLALPIIGGMVSQNVLNLVDAAMVGSLGDAALAATGMGSFANFMAMAFITGLATGVQAMASRRMGEGRDSETAVPLNGGLLMALTLGVPWAVVVYFATPWLFPYLVDDPEVVAQGVPYLQARVTALAAVGMNFAFRGYWNGVNLSHLYMRTLVLMHIINISLNYVLIFGKLGFPAYGAEGAGMASAASVWVGLAYYVVLGMRHARGAGFLAGIPDRDTLRTMLRLALPSGVQQFFFAAGMTALFWIVGQVGTAELAAANVLVQLLLVAILPGMAFGIAGASLVGQALGRKDPDDAMAWGWDVAKVASVTVGLLALPAAVVPELFLGIFLHDPETLALAALPLRVVAGAMALDTVGMVLLNTLLGAGDTRRVMMVSLIAQWCFFLPVAYLVGPVLGYGLLGIWLAQVVYRCTQALVLAGMWRGGKWKHIKL